MVQEVQEVLAAHRLREDITQDSLAAQEHPVNQVPLEHQAQKEDITLANPDPEALPVDQVIITFF